MTLSPALTTASSQVMIGTGDLLDMERAVASQHWAAGHVNDNPAFRWVVAKYVEGDNPNSNNHLWSGDDLKASAESIVNTPMNLLHRSHHIVGSFTGAKYLETEAEGSLAAAQEVNPHIEVVGPVWRYYFPNELATIEAAFEEGSLFVSMECVAETARWHNATGETKDFPYRGPNDDSYGEWQAKGNVLQFVNPLFLGGGLIIPPTKPGWSGAEVKEIAALIEKNQDDAESVYAAIAEAAPHLDPGKWEQIMLVVMKGYEDS